MPVLVGLHVVSPNVVDLVQSKEKRSPTRRCEDWLLSGLVQDAYIVVALPRLEDSVVGDVEGLYVVSFTVEQIMSRKCKRHCFYTGYRPASSQSNILLELVIGG